jgi:hypothetical protein
MDENLGMGGLGCCSVISLHQSLTFVDSVTHPGT